MSRSRTRTAQDARSPVVVGGDSRCPAESRPRVVPVRPEWVRFRVPGRPVAGNRTLRWARGRVYRTVEYRAYVETVAACARAVVQGGTVLEGPVRVEMVATFPHRGSLPDIDALPKAVLDALTGIVWRDDRQVEELLVVRMVRPGEGPWVDVTIYRGDDV